MKLAKRIERVPLAWPMALLMAAAVAFLMFAMPARIMQHLLAATGISSFTPGAAAAIGATTRTVLAATFAGAAGGAVWLLFHMLDGPRPTRADPAADSTDDDVGVDLFASRESVQPAPPPAPLLRRKDVHPDAPARRPLFAASDLGTPLDDQPAAPRRAPIFADQPEAAETAIVAEAIEADSTDDALLLELEDIVDGPSELQWSLPGAAAEQQGMAPTSPREADASIRHSAAISIAAAAAIQPAHEAARAPGTPVEVARSVVQPAPAAEPVAAAPADVAFADESLAGLMARLERGLAARAGGSTSSLPPAPASAAGTLRQALNELRSMATRR